MPGIELDVLVHCVLLMSAGHTGVISTPKFGACIARLIELIEVLPSKMQILGTAEGNDPNALDDAGPQSP